MAIKASTGLRNSVLVTGSLKAALANGFIKIYSGAAPADADAAATGTLLCTIGDGDGSTGLNLAATASGGVVQKDAGESWQGACLATGTAAYYRHVGASDTGALSTTEPRIQGSVGTVGTDLELSSVALVSAAIQTIDYYSVAFPA